MPDLSFRGRPPKDTKRPFRGLNTLQLTSYIAIASQIELNKLGKLSVWAE